MRGMLFSALVAIGSVAGFSLPSEAQAADRNCPNGNCSVSQGNTVVYTVARGHSGRHSSHSHCYQPSPRYYYHGGHSHYHHGGYYHHHHHYPYYYGRPYYYQPRQGVQYYYDGRNHGIYYGGRSGGIFFRF